MQRFVKNMLRNNNMFGVHFCQNKIISNIITQEEDIPTKICRPESLIQPKPGRTWMT